MTYPRLQGVWLPLASPFRDDRLDEASLRRMVRAYAGKVDGLVLAATTGEGMALSADETRRLVQWTQEELAAAAAPTPILLGVSGAVTAKVAQALREAEAWPVDGFLIACPYYVRPSQEGLRLHFETLAAATTKALVVYNIPYRTGVNLANDTLLALAAEQRNIIGVKDCCADPAQTLDLLARKPAGFSVLAGEDAGLLPSLRAGADGGVVASAHLAPEGFRRLYVLAIEGRWAEADALWSGLAAIPELLFAEPNPAPLKHALWRRGLIDSPQLRLPMTPVSADLAQRLDGALARRAPAD